MKLYSKILNLAILALYDDRAYNELEIFSKESKLQLSKISRKYPITNNALIDYLKKGTDKDMTYLLKDLRFKTF